ncbi:trypsin-3-like [Phymastichus coffea]|uniref:trypsin-3-like n=1 Tax=Phymastichus coffea TaxID=108790 RepID=UPI00273BEAFB|nr:trypsin-3-like [Phymastichus coffea]
MLMLQTFFDSLPAFQTTNSNTSLNFCKHCACGVNRRTRIVNGEITTFEEFPWAAQIKYHHNHHCGGSLITARHILTAAHCLYEFDQKSFTIHLANGATYRVKRVKIHQQYEHANNDNDIAIIELNRAVTLGVAVTTVCLPSAPTFKQYGGRTAVAIGWGRIGSSEPVSEDLRKVDLPIMSDEECLQADYRKNRITDNMFCAGYFEGGRDSCKGDSGGPLLVRNDVGAMEVVGIVSFGRGCAKPRFPGVYTKVSNYLGWIGQNLRNECLCSPASEL